MTAQATKAGEAPQWTKTASAEAEVVKQGTAAAGMISSALSNMSYGANPWAALTANLVTPKPHKRGDAAYQALTAAQAAGGRLKLMNFRRVKQLGAGDVGLVDLVQLQGTEHKCVVLGGFWFLFCVWGAGARAGCGEGSPCCWPPAAGRRGCSRLLATQPGFPTTTNNQQHTPPPPTPPTPNPTNNPHQQPPNNPQPPHQPPPGSP